MNFLWLVIGILPQYCVEVYDPYHQDVTTLDWRDFENPERLQIGQHIRFITYSMDTNMWTWEELREVNTELDWVQNGF